MYVNKPVKRIAIVGTGVIGASWAAEYLARGFEVVATDPAPNAEANLRKYIDDAWKDLTTIGLGGGAGGIKHFMDHLMDPLAGVIRSLGTPDITPELKQTIVEGVLREAGKRSVDELAQQENELIIGLLRSRAQS